MLKLTFVFFLAILSRPALAATDFAVRTVGGRTPPLAGQTFTMSPLKTNVADAARLAERWGRVTSVRRSPAHNRAVGGVPNSFHLSGRAIDIARGPGVRHADIAAAFRNAGYRLIESLDEGDHSHFAFGTGRGAPTDRMAEQTLATHLANVTRWRIVLAPR